MNTVKRTVSYLLCAVVLTSALLSSFSAAADNTAALSVQGSYSQSDARSLLTKINTLRLGNDAWYYDEDGVTEISVVGALGAYVYDYALEQAAMQRAAELALRYGHIRPDGSSAATAYGAGVSVSENIAFGCSSAEEVFAALLQEDGSYDTQGERRAMLSDYYTAFGAAHFTCSGAEYWVLAMRRTAGDTTQTEPSDGAALVPVTLAKNTITSYILTSAVRTVSGNVGETVSLPAVTASVRTAYQKDGAGAVRAALTPLWLTEDGNIAAVEDNALALLNAGETVLQASSPDYPSANVLRFTVTVRECDHQFTVTQRIEPTCTEPGELTETCSVCGTVRTTVLEAPGHTVVTDEAVAATCTQDGLTEGSHCSVCGTVFTEQTVVSAYGHNWSDWTTVTAPEACKNGVSRRVCSRCGEQEEKVLPGSGEHTYIAETVKAPTATEEGLVRYTCSVCGDTKTETLPKITKTGWVKEDGKWFFYNTNGVKATGWLKDGGKWYLLAYADGHMLTGWVKSGGKWYWFNTSGAMVTGWQKISGKWYWFNTSGAMVTGWQKISGKWYYFNTNGDMKTGWLKDGGKWYYLDTSGAMLANTSKTISGKTYKFNSAGVCTNP